MENSKLDIWAIQNYPEEIHNALENVKDSPTNMLFTNCLSYLRLGNRLVQVHFDTAFYSEDSDTLILLMQDGELTSDKFKELLKDRKIGYHEINFQDRKRKHQKPTKELWFAREEYVLNDALQDSKGKGIDTCDYYPAVEGKLELRYAIDDGRGVSFFDVQPIHGVVILEDKIILNINHQEERNISYKQALKAFIKNDVAVSVRKEKNLPKEAIPKQYKKEQ